MVRLTVSKHEAEAALRSFGIDLLALCEQIGVSHIDADVIVGTKGSYITATAWDVDGVRVANVAWELSGGDAR